LILQYVVVAIPQALFPCAVLAAAAMGLNLILSKADDIQPLIVFSKIGICAIAYLGALFLNPKTRLFIRDL
jgi:Na+-transporting methylmalonyl-CoA/oxaloacetate decarboxylase beta subunit